MEPFATLHAKAVPLLVDNVDTDVITPIGRVLQGGSALVEFAFEPLRYDAAGRLHGDCPLDDPRYAGAQILIAGENFACGSSRETAVWAVRGLGFRCVIAPSFGDIFYNNCFKNGMLPIVLPQAEVDKLMQDAEKGANATVSIDLEAQTITRPDGETIGFDLDPFRKHCLINGLDDIGLTLQQGDKIDGFEAARRASTPWLAQTGSRP